MPKIRVDKRCFSNHKWFCGTSYIYPSLEFNSSTSNARQSATESSNHGEALHIAASYEGEMEGVYVVGIGSISVMQKVQQVYMPLMI